MARLMKDAGHDGATGHTGNARAEPRPGLASRARPTRAGADDEGAVVGGQEEALSSALEALRSEARGGW